MNRIKILLLVFALLTVSSCKNNGQLVISEKETTPVYSDEQTQLQTEKPPFASSRESANATSVSSTVQEIITAPEETPMSDLPKLNANSNNEITITAGSLLGIPFAEGGADPDAGFDNSGFIYYVLRQNGFLSTPRRVSEQADMGDKISSLSELKPGDLVFFSTGGEKAEYGGIYIGDNVMIFSPKPGELVKEQDISGEYWKGVFFKGIRVL
ncbi:MAG: C40 family peptidase [Eubacterium sp.]|jgi:cell wall-associated NlpC family hydrolase|nr:C40 family peptidase [Eubacterium sp.]